MGLAGVNVCSLPRVLIKDCYGRRVSRSKSALRSQTLALDIPKSILERRLKTAKRDAANPKCAIEIESLLRQAPQPTSAICDACSTAGPLYVYRSRYILRYSTTWESTRAIGCRRDQICLCVTVLMYHERNSYNFTWNKQFFLVYYI